MIEYLEFIENWFYAANQTSAENIMRNGCVVAWDGMVMIGDDGTIECQPLEIGG